MLKAIELNSKYVLYTYREYPGTKAIKNETRTPGNPADKDEFSHLVTELHDAFQKEGYVLSAALSAGKPTIDRAYDAKILNEKLNFLNIMTYDFHGAWENHTGMRQHIQHHAIEIH